jgi:hypothetical protein
MIIANKSNTLMIWIVLAAVIGWRLQDFFDLGMATTDQLEFSTDLLDRGIWQAALDYARQHFLLTVPIHLFAATYATSPIVQAVSLSLFVIVPGLVAWTAFRDHTDQAFFLLIYWTFCATGWNHTTPAAYPITPMVPFIFIGAAALVAQSHAKAPSWLKLFAYGLFTFMVFFQYEPAALTAIILLLWFIHTRVLAPGQRRNLYGTTALSLGLYAVAYIVWRMIYPSGYEGATLGNLSPIAIIRVLLAYAIGALPLAHLFGGMPSIVVGDAIIGRQVLSYPALNMGSLLSSIEWMDIVVSVLAGALLWLLLSERQSRVSVGEQRHVATPSNELYLAVLIMLSSNILLAFSQKYQLWVQAGWTAYLTSYCALFGWIILITCFSRYVLRRWLAVVLTLGLLAIFLYSGAYNHSTARQIRANFSRWHTVNALVACKPYLNTYRSFVFPAAFYGIFQTSPNWSLYWRDWTSRSFGSPVHIVPDAASVATGSAAFIQPSHDDRGKLKAVAGYSGSRGFLIYRSERPNYLWMHQQPDSHTGPMGELMIVDSLAESICSNGYRMVTFEASHSISSIDVFWHLPNIVATSNNASSLFTIPDAEVERAIQALYLGFFKRPADLGGFQYWVAKVRRSGGTIRDVAEGFAAHPERPKEPPNGEFSLRLSESYQYLTGRNPRPEELKRLNSFRDRQELFHMLPWIVIADLLTTKDAAFMNRLTVAQHYTEITFPIRGWRKDIWEQAFKRVNEKADTVNQALSILRQ